MPRTILVHLNLEVADGEKRTADEIAQLIDAALYVGLEGADDADGITNVSVALAEEV
jgi:hypothetical protein